MTVAWHARVGRWLLWPVGLVPLAYLFYLASGSGFGPDPAEYLSAFSGEWALWWLLLSLSVTPLRQYLGWAWLVPYRQVLGLLSWGYASLHVLVYLALWLDWSWAEFGTGLQKRPYVWMGMLAYAGLWPLALTSSRWMMRRLGRHWKHLHRAVYGIVLAAITHVLWQSKGDIGEAAGYALITLVLLALRWRPQRKKTVPGEAQNSL